jgi:hypothetical protein
MSQVLSADDLLQIKEVLMEELNIMNGEGPSNETDRLLSGFAAKRADFSVFEEQLIRRIITNDVNGKLPSELLREQIIKNIFATNNKSGMDGIKRNAAGAIKIDNTVGVPSPVLLTLDTVTTRYKKAKIKYVFDVTFSEFVVNVDNSAEIIEQLKEQIESLKNKMSLLETDKTNFKDVILGLEIDNASFRDEINALQQSISEEALGLATQEQDRQEELRKIQEEAQRLVVDATTRLTQKESEFAEFKAKVEMVFIASNTYEEIIENFKKIGIGA